MIGLGRSGWTNRFPAWLEKPSRRLASSSRARPPQAEPWRQSPRATAECEFDLACNPDRSNRAWTLDRKTGKDPPVALNASSRPNQLGAVLATSRPSASRRSPRRGQRSLDFHPSRGSRALTSLARGARLRLRSGRRDGRRGRTKGWSIASAEPNPIRLTRNSPCERGRWRPKATDGVWKAGMRREGSLLMVVQACQASKQRAIPHPAP